MLNIRDIDPCFFGKSIEEVNIMSFERFIYGELGRDDCICSIYRWA